MSGVLNLSKFHTSENVARINRNMFPRESEISKFNCRSENKELLKVTGIHPTVVVSWKQCKI